LAPTQSRLRSQAIPIRPQPHRDDAARDPAIPGPSPTRG
jgi:hypothetical protein